MKLNQDFEMSIETILFLKDRESTSYVQTQQIAEALDYSVGYLQKVVQTLSKHGIVDCKRGRIGGVRLTANVITLYDLWKATCGELDLTNPPLAVMEKPLRAFRDAMSKVVIYKRKRR